MLLAGEGRIDLDYVMTMLRTGGTVPEGDMADVVARFDAGEEWDASPAHRANAFVVAGKPDKGPHGIYRGCVGPAERLVNVNSPGHGYYYYDETAAFWEIVLAEKAEDMTRQAAELARHRVEEGRAALAGWSDTDRESRLYMHEMIDDADQALASAADFKIAPRRCRIRSGCVNCRARCDATRARRSAPVRCWRPSSPMRLHSRAPLGRRHEFRT